MKDRCTSTARPYADAAFDSALANDDLTKWRQFLRHAAAIARAPAMQQLIDDPRVTTEYLLDLLRTLLPTTPDQRQANFLHLLLRYDRFRELPQIFAGFKLRLARYSNNCPVYVCSAQTLTEAWQQQLTQALARRFRQNVVPDFTVNPKLLGGATIEAQDRIIDGSIRGRLDRLGKYLRAS